MSVAVRAGLVVLLGTGAFAQAPGPASAVLYEGARLITGDAGPPIERGASWCRTAQIRAVGRRRAP